MKFISLLLASLAFLISGCDSSSGGGWVQTSPESPPDTTDISNRLYVLAAGSGRTASTSGSDYIITLEGVHPEVDWYTDRPERETGDEDTEDFINASWQRVYADTAPNALLHYRNASGVRGMFGAVRDVAYDADAATLRFTLNLEEAIDDPSVSARASHIDSAASAADIF